MDDPETISFKKEKPKTKARKDLTTTCFPRISHGILKSLRGIQLLDAASPLFAYVVVTESIK